MFDFQHSFFIVGYSLSTSQFNPFNKSISLRIGPNGSRVNKSVYELSNFVSVRHVRFRKYNQNQCFVF